MKYNYIIKVKVIPRQSDVAQGAPGRLRPRIILTFRHYKGGRSSAKRIGRLYPRRNPWYSKYIINQQDATLAVLCLLKTTSMLYMFRTPFASIIRSTINFNSSHWCLS